MPVEVKELHIKVSITDEQAGGGAGSGSAGGEDAQEVIIRACVEKVLQILKDQKDR